MKTTVLKVTRIGNSRGLRLPARILKKYQITDSVIVEEGIDEIILRPDRSRTDLLSWKETYQAMVEENEDWSAWEETASDGLDEIPWETTEPESSPSVGKEPQSRRKA